MNAIDILKEKIKGSETLFKPARNLYALNKGFVSLGLGRRGSLEHIKSTVSLIKKDNKIWGRPVNITIEPANVCNLKCPVCETGEGILDRRKKFLSLDDFKIIIDKIYKHTNTILYYFMGETFLNKTWVDQVLYAKEKGIPHIWTCTNGDFANANDIIRSKIDMVSFQIGGMTQKAHETYRVNSNLERVLKNLEETVKLKQEKNADWLEIEVGFILMKHNENEVDKFVAYCENLGVKYNVIDPCVRNIEQGDKFLPTNEENWIYDPIAYKKGVLQRKFYQKNECSWIHYAMNVMVNGDVVPCCHDPKGTKVMGNLLTQDLDEIWNGEKYQAFRKEINTNQKNMDICSLCSGYGVSGLV